MKNDNLEIVRRITSDLLSIIGINSVVTANYSHSDECILINIQTEQTNSGFLIGQGGINLDSLQHLTRLLVNKKTNQSIKFILDVNNYRKHRISLLKATAKDIAKQVLLERTSLALKPMPAYERRIIHLALSDNPLIDTESVGQEPERRIVVRVRSDV